jgi:glycosyltransferase involved in cell wall biosynthesis
VGGTIRTTFNTASALADRHDVEIVSVLRRRDEPELELDPRVRLRALTDMRPDRRGRAAEWASQKPSKVFHRGDFRYKGFSGFSDVQLLRYLASVRDGVLVATRPGLNLAIARYARRSVVRVGQDHMNLAGYRPELRASIARHYARLDLVTALTQGSADEYTDLLGGRVRVEAIPNGVTSLGMHHADPSAKLVVAAGRLGKRKGFDRLFPAWARVAPEFPEWRLAIFGGGPWARKLARLVDEFGLGASVQLRGNSPTLPEELAKASLFVMTSRREGFPMVLLEAMSVGLPVIAYDCPTGPRDIITDGVDGYIVRDGDTEALAASLAELMDADDERRRLGVAALDKAAAFDITLIAARWEALLEELVAGKRRVRRATAAGPRGRCSSGAERHLRSPER